MWGDGVEGEEGDDGGTHRQPTQVPARERRITKPRLSQAVNWDFGSECELELGDGIGRGDVEVLCHIGTDIAVYHRFTININHNLSMCICVVVNDLFMLLAWIHNKKSQIWEGKIFNHNL